MEHDRQDLISEENERLLDERDSRMQQAASQPFRTLGRQNAQADWDAVEADRQRTYDDSIVSYNQSKFDQFTPIIQRANEQEAMAENDRRIAGAYMLCDAYNNGGLSNRAIGEALTTAFGRPVYGCQIFRGLEGDQAALNGWAGIYGQTQDPQTGKTGIGLIGAMSPQDQLMLLQKSNLGDRTLGARRMLYGELSKGKTADQMLQMGFQNPDGPYVVGGVGGKGVSALAGRTAPRHSRISFFASDGKGGGMRSEYNGHTGDRSEEDLGTWSDGNSGQWNQVSVGPSDTNNGGSDKSQVRVYENSKTGERVTVKDGENLRDVLAKYNVYSTSGRRGTLGLRDSGTRTSSGTVGTTAEDKLAYLREQEKLRTERELAVQKSRNDAKASTQKPNNMSDEMFNALVTVMQSPDAMKNKDIASLVSGIKAQYGIGDGSASRTGISGSLDEANKDGDRMTIDQFSKEEQDMIKNAPMPEGWIEGESSWNRVKEKDPLAVLRSLNVRGRQLDGGEQIIRYTDENGRVVETNGFRDKAGRLYGVRTGADGKNYRGDEIKDYGKREEGGESVAEEGGGLSVGSLTNTEDDDRLTEGVIDEFTTTLDKDEESAYQAWRAKQPKNLQYEGDYDLRGYYQDMKKNGKLPDIIGRDDHLPDTYKKPSHETFSVESKYATGENKKKSGRWVGDKFVPAKNQRTTRDDSKSVIDDIVKKAKSVSLKAYGTDNGPNYEILLRRSLKNNGFSDVDIDDIMSIMREDDDAKTNNMRKDGDEALSKMPSVHGRIEEMRRRRDGKRK